jgi:mRNA-degrading endonuclease RelE of RelBE toxin-antitoxin system
VTELFYRGSKRTIVWARDASGRLHGREYFEGLPPNDQAKVEALLRRMGDHGEIRNKEKFKHEEGGFYCFKSFKRRLMCFFDRNLVVITHGFDKKRDRLDRKQLERGQRISQVYESGQQRR